MAPHRQTLALFPLLCATKYDGRENTGGAVRLLSPRPPQDRRDRALGPCPGFTCTGGCATIRATMRRRTRKGRVTLVTVAVVGLVMLTVVTDLAGVPSAALKVTGRGLGLTRPELLLVPIIITVVWVAIGSTAILMGFHAKDKARARRDALRARLLREEGVTPTEDADAGDRKQIH